MIRGLVLLVIIGITGSQGLEARCQNWLESLVLIQRQHQRLMQQWGDTESEQLIQKLEESVTVVAGTPTSVRELGSPEKNQSFRHYISDEESYEKIIEQSVLQAGNSPFMTNDSSVVQKYRDLTGIFFTLPEVSSISVVGKSSPYYVDFTIPDSVPVLALNERNFLIPADVPTPQWMLEIYHRVQSEREELTPFERQVIQQIEDRGRELQHDRVWVPIEIQHHGKVDNSRFPFRP